MADFRDTFVRSPAMWTSVASVLNQRDRGVRRAKNVVADVVHGAIEPIVERWLHHEVASLGECRLPRRRLGTRHAGPKSGLHAAGCHALMKASRSALT